MSNINKKRSSLSSARNPQRTALAIAISLSLAGPVYAETINVDGATCNLVNAITSANSGSPIGGCTTGSVGADTLVLANSSIHSLTVVNNTIDGANGLPSITSAITIQGNGSTIERSGGTEFRLFHVATTGTLTLNSVTLSNGLRIASTNRTGGAILSRGMVTLNNSTVSGSSASSGGGIAVSEGSLSLSNSTVSGNSATSNYGGGIFTEGGSATISNSTVSGNGAFYDGGGIFVGFYADMNVVDSTVSGNFAGGIAAWSAIGVNVVNSTVSGNMGPGIDASYFGEVTVINSTISGNTASAVSGGISVDRGVANLINSTVSGNTPYGIAVGIQHAYGSVSLSNSIVANSGVTDCVNNASITANNKNIIEDDSCTTSALSLDPNLGPLADNDGPTQTHALLAGSLAIDAGDNAVCAATPVNNLDQRGYPRPFGDFCDIGAYEFSLESSSFFIIPIQGGKSVIFDL